MKKHIKIYYDFFNYSPGDLITDELLGGKADDIHHIEARGMGGRPSMDRIDNLMALNRWCHDYYGDKKQYKEFLKKVHECFMDSKGSWLYIQDYAYDECFEPLIKSPYENILKHYRQ